MEVAVTYQPLQKVTQDMYLGLYQTILTSKGCGQAEVLRCISVYVLGVDEGVEAEQLL